MKKSKHVVLAVTFADDESSIACVCEASTVTATPEDAAAWFTRHRLDTGSGYGKPGARETDDSPKWKKGANSIAPSPRAIGTGKTSAEIQRAYRQRHPERLAEYQRAYRARKRAEAAA